jgi:hypothetical protein
MVYSGLTFEIGGDPDVRDVGDDRPQGAGDRAMAGDLFLGILSRWVSSCPVVTRAHVFAELLARLQLHVPAATIRKHIELEEIKSNALVRQ